MSANNGTWPYTEIALLIGLRAMGEDYDAIARVLKRERADVIACMRTARRYLREETWIAGFLDDIPDDEGPGGKALRRALVAPRRYSIVPDLDDMIAAERQARKVRPAPDWLPGDPPPGRSAYDARESAKEGK